MPLQDHLPVIDDRAYDTIVNEARSRIPRYTPEWTNLNESDPGITMIELFAWMTEMQIYRLAQVPQLNYLKFLELIGIELEPAKAATAKLSFPVLPTYGKDITIVPAKTQVSTEESDEEGPVIFETDKALTVIRSSLLNLLIDDGFNYRDVSNENLDASESFQPFGSTAVRDNSFMLGFDKELPEATIHLTVWVPIVENDIVVSQCFSDTPIINSSKLVWEFWNGREWTGLNLLKDETSGLTRSGDILLKGPAKGLMAAQTFADLKIDRFWIRLRIDSSGYDTAPKIITIRTNTTSATQAETFEFEVLGGSNGEIDQQLSLRYSPVIAGSLTLEVDEGPGYQAWQEVVDFFGSGGDDPHFVLNRATGEVRFGDGTNGRVPVANANNRSNIRVVVYRVGGGKRGNTGANKINTLLDSLDGIEANAVSNLFAAAGGANEETLDAAIKRAPQAIKSRDRAVTAEDYEELAIRSTNIARAKALPLYHPSYAEVEVPGVVTVVVVPDVEGASPVPSEGTLQTVCAFLNQRRLLTSELFVTGPSYKTVVVRVELIVDDKADLAEIKSRSLESLELYFHPITGGEGSDPERSIDDPERSGGGWPFGGEIYYSLLYRRLLFTGVKRIASLIIEVNGVEYPECQDVIIGEGILLTNGNHDVQVNYEVSR